MEQKVLRIAIAESSVIIRSGLSVALKRIPELIIQPFEIVVPDTIKKYLETHRPDVLIINPYFWGMTDIDQLKESINLPKLKCIALSISPIENEVLKKFDSVIGIYDSIELLQEKLEKLFKNAIARKSTENSSLSSREREILICAVKGMTNKETAEKLFLSAHTVITHRRNIARKLEIHSIAGLTIYAIANKLVDIDEIDNKKL